MIYIQIKELIATRKYQWGRKVTVSEVADATGISRMTLSRMMRNQTHNTVIEHVDKLCNFFECELHELVTYVPDRQIKQAA